MKRSEAEALVEAWAEVARYAALDVVAEGDEDSMGYWRELRDAKDKLVGLLTKPESDPCE